MPPDEDMTRKPQVIKVDSLGQSSSKCHLGKEDQGIENHLQGLGGPMTRARSKKAKEALNKLVASLIEEMSIDGPKISEQSPKQDDIKDKVVLCIKSDDY